jgi:thiamine-monophosphate kinase
MMVCGFVGDGWLGLKAARGEIADPGGLLAAHYRTPRPLLMLRDLLSKLAKAAADVSDGLLADARHVARASGLGLSVDLEQMPLSTNAAVWCARQGDRVQACLALATGGDDYAIVCAVDPADEQAFLEGVARLELPAARVGIFEAGDDVRVRVGDRPVSVGSHGWRH